MTIEPASAVWVTVPREIAEKHPLYGIGGWMITVILRCASIPLTVGTSVIPLYTLFAQAESATPAFRALLALIVLSVGLTLWAVANLFLIFRRHHLFPKSYIGYLLLLTVYVVVSAYATNDVAPLQDPTGREAITRLIRTIGAFVGAAIWIAYAVVSQRVNVTFLNRVRSGDPILKETVAEIF